MASDGPLRQISLNNNCLRATPHKMVSEVDEDAYKEELQCFRQSLLRSCNQWPLGFDISASPLPLLAPETLLAHLDKLGNLLCHAITSIVERWWTDPIANFPERMPLLPHQEAVLRVSTQSNHN